MCPIQHVYIIGLTCNCHSVEKYIYCHACAIKTLLSIAKLLFSLHSIIVRVEIMQFGQVGTIQINKVVSVDTKNPYIDCSRM